jgi:hypothetical protein
MNADSSYWRLSAFIRGPNILGLPLALLASLAVQRIERWSLVRQSFSLITSVKDRISSALFLIQTCETGS